jgi:PAS domain S-box-containing protein
MTSAEFFDDISPILDSTIGGIVLIENGFIINVNQPFLDILNYKKEEVVGHLASGCLLPFSKEKFIEYNHSFFQEITLLAKNGEIIPAIIKIKDIVYKEHTLKMVSILDLTQTKENELIMLKQSRFAAMGEMISMIAHQWRQPLSSIAAIISSVKLKIAKESLDLKKLDKKSDEINTHLQYMSQTIDDFRSFFKNDKQKQWFYLNDLLNETINMVSPSFQNCNIQIQFSEKNMKQLYLLENELLQVFLNILNNSKDAFLQNQTKTPLINIDLQEDDKYQIVYITDNAGGIDPEMIHRVFEPYFTTKDNLNGTGIGLYMSKMIIEKHCQGRISVNNIDEGCCFKVMIAK